MTVLAGVLGLDRTTLTRNIKVLEQRGLVCTRAHEDDVRVRMASITAAGSRELSDALARWEGVQAGVEERFGAARLRALYDELDELAVAVAVEPDRRRYAWYGQGKPKTAVGPPRRWI